MFLLLAMVCSFVKAPFISPERIERITGACVRNPCVSVEVWNSFGEEYWKEPFVEYGFEGCFPIYFEYACVGEADGVYVLLTSERGGGTGIFRGLLFVELEREPFFEEGEWGERVVAKKVGEYCLGDRWVGEVKVKGNSVFIYTKGYQCLPEEKGGWSVVDLIQDGELGNKIDKA